VAGAAALALVAVQGAFDVVHRDSKPSGCRWNAVAEP
jgi:hypothetical protein